MSSINFQAAQTVANLVFAPVGADGKVVLSNGSAGPTQLIADIAGYVRGCNGCKPPTFHAGQAPSLNDAVSPPPNTIDCPAVDRCVAIGQISQSASGTPAALAGFSQDEQGAWTSTEFPLPSDATGIQINSGLIKCAGVALCVALGRYDNSHGSAQAQDMIVRRVAGTWSATTAARPTDWTNQGLSAPVSTCASPDMCVGVGDYANGDNHFVGYAENVTATSATAMSLPVPPDAYGDPEVQFTSISCSTSTWCVAVGGYRDSHGLNRPMIDTFANGVWTSQSAPLLSGYDIARFGPLASVSCASVDHCVAVGAIDNDQVSDVGVIETLADGIWTVQRAPRPTGANPADEYDRWHSVACPTVTFCAATGSYADDAVPGVRHASLAIFSGGKWSIVRAPDPNAEWAQNYTLVGQMVCTEPGACSAVIGPGRLGYYVATLVGGQWVPMPFDPGDHPIAQVRLVYGLWCPQTGHCVLAGRYDDEGSRSFDLFQQSAP